MRSAWKVRVAGWILPDGFPVERAINAARSRVEEMGLLLTITRAMLREDRSSPYFQIKSARSSSELVVDQVCSADGLGRVKTHIQRSIFEEGETTFGRVNLH